MSYLGTCSDAVATIHSIEESENTHSSSGSTILHGHDSPGGAASSGASTPAGQNLMPGRLRAGIKTPRVRKGTEGSAPVRHYAATDREHPRG
jgi:hypothetical protein